MQFLLPRRNIHPGNCVFEPPGVIYSTRMATAGSIIDGKRPSTWKVLLAFGIIYFVWGSTFLAIRVGVHDVPPFLLAAMRFLLAGVILYAWLRVLGTASPSRREWASATVVAVLIFVFDYGLLFWAERR